MLQGAWADGRDSCRGVPGTPDPRRHVRISGVDGKVEAYDNHQNLIGESVDPNGRSGFAYWDREQDLYAVTTLDGLVLYVPEANLEEPSHTWSEDGGHDLLWPGIPTVRVGETFAARVAEALQCKGYCVIQMPDSGSRQRAVQASSARSDYTIPKTEFEEMYLGASPKSKIVWLDTRDPESGEDPLVHYQRLMMKLYHGLFGVAGDMLGFRPWEYCGMMVRRPLMSELERDAISGGPVTEDDVDQGVVEKNLDFVQRRRLCMMYVINGDDASIELRARAGAGQAAASIPLAQNTMVVFRHDHLNYAYSAADSSNLVLQSWLLQEPTCLKLDAYEGGAAEMQSVLSGPMIAPEIQVHVRSGVCRFPANAYQLARDWACYLAQTDAFVEVPIGRFDVCLYWAPTEDQFNSIGKSATRHIGALADQELMDFDNELFGMPPEEAFIIPSSLRITMEVCYEMLHNIGHTRESMNGFEMFTAIADQGSDWDTWMGYSEVTEAWSRASWSHNILAHNRVAYHLGLVGPSVSVDTACSASFCASNMCHAYLRSHDRKRVDTAMSCGQQHVNTPWSFIGLSSAGMIGRTGRCLTFDMSANGYNRGEGSGGLISTVGDNANMQQERLVCYCGSFINQDGRSASLTAPNGPSQQMVVRNSLRQGLISPEDVSATENHGTGTALGDPIEVGTLRGVFRKRETCLPITSAKTHMGHLETGAGSVGILKTILSINHSCVPANTHLRQLTSHAEIEGFPASFPVEALTLNTAYHHAGANGFGFGGTNARADFWGHHLSGRTAREATRKIVGASWDGHLRIDVLGSTTPTPEARTRLSWLTVTCTCCLGPMCWLCAAATPLHVGPERHRCSAIRSESSTYTFCSNCYVGPYLREQAAPVGRSTRIMPGQRLCMCGTWDAWTTLGEMSWLTQREEIDIFEGEIYLSDVGWEQFHLVLEEGSARRVIHPVVKRAGPQVRIAGPSGDSAEGRNWLIDGRGDGAPEGTLYKVRFEWTDAKMSIAWWPLREAPRLGAEEAYMHRYYICSSASSWKPVVGNEGGRCPVEPGLWSFHNGWVPASGIMEFMFLRDNDRAQMIYPRQHLPTDTSVPVMGPDEGGSGKRWQLHGEPGESTYVHVQVVEGVVSVRAWTKTMGEATYRSRGGPEGQAYSVAGSWSRWGMERMERGAAECVHTCRFALGPTGREEFQIVRDENWHFVMYPPRHRAPPGEELVCGPDHRGKNKNWEVLGPPGQVMEVTLDLGAEDQRDIVTCRPCR